MLIYQGEDFTSLVAVTRSQATPAAKPLPPAAHTSVAPAATVPAPPAVPNDAPALIQHQPLPKPFAPTAVSRGIPPSSLPDPVRRARQSAVQPTISPAAAPPAPILPLHSSTDTVAVATSEEAALTASITFVASQGPGILEHLMLDSPYVLANMNGSTMRIPVSALRIPLTRDLLSNLLQPAAPSLPTADHAAQALAALYPASEDGHDSGLPALLDLSSSKSSFASLPSYLGLSMAAATPLSAPYICPLGLD